MYTTNKFIYFKVWSKTMMTVIEFQEKFNSEQACADHFFKMKWSNGFSCPRCKHNEAYILKNRSLWQCKSCDYQASLKAGTVFHRLKHSLFVLLWACYWVATTKKGISALELKRKLGIKSYQTAWLLLHKIRLGMKSSGNFPLTSDVEFDDTYLGKDKESDDKKRALANIVVESDGKNIGRAYIENLPNQQSITVKKFIFKTVIQGVKIKTDGNVSYKFLKNYFEHLPMKMYDKKDNNKHLPKVHIIIANLKNWLRGTYNHMPNKHAQSYLDEFCFRFNRRWSIENSFDKLFTKLIINKTVTYSELTG